MIRHTVKDVLTDRSVQRDFGWQGCVHRSAFQDQLDVQGALAGAVGPHLLAAQWKRELSDTLKSNGS